MAADDPVIVTRAVMDEIFAAVKIVKRLAAEMEAMNKWKLNPTLIVEGKLQDDLDAPEDEQEPEEATAIVYKLEGSRDEGTDIWDEGLREGGGKMEIDVINRDENASFSEDQLLNFVRLNGAWKVLSGAGGGAMVVRTGQVFGAGQTARASVCRSNIVKNAAGGTNWNVTVTTKQITLEQVSPRAYLMPNTYYLAVRAEGYKNPVTYGFGWNEDYS
jgi:hypothetical protein